MKLKIILVLIFGMCLNFYNFSQERKIKKAYHEMANKEFQKARHHSDVYLKDEPKSPLGYFVLAKYFGNESNVNRNLDSCFLNFMKSIILFGNVSDKDQLDYCEEFQFCNINFKYQKDSITNLAFQEFKLKNVVFSDSINDLGTIISNTKNFINIYSNIEMNSKFMDDVNSYLYDKAYLLAKTKNTIVDYSNYIKEYPYSPFVKEANDKIEWIEYLNAKKNNSVELYSNFLTKYPNSKFTSEITKLRDTIEFTEAEKVNTIESYSGFIKKYPNSKLLNDAISSRDKIIISNVIKENTLASVEEFILKYPNSPQIKKAYALQSKFIYYDTVGVTNISYTKKTKESSTKLTYQKVLYPKNLVLENKINDSINNFITELINWGNECQNNYESRITYNQNGLLSSFFKRISAECYRQEYSDIYVNTIDLKTGSSLNFSTEFLPDSRNKIAEIIKANIEKSQEEEGMTTERKDEIKKEIDESFSFWDDIFITNSAVVFTPSMLEAGKKQEITFYQIKDFIKPNSALQRVFNKPLYYSETTKQPTIVKIGTQTWSSSDFNGTCFQNGEPIMEVFTDYAWNLAGKQKKSCFRVLDNGTFVYNGFALQDERGICPKGFRIPELSDFKLLLSFLGGGENAVKRISSYNWSEDYEAKSGGLDTKNIISNNNSSFSAKQGGAAYNRGDLVEGECSFWWSNTESKYFDSEYGVTTNLGFNVLGIGNCSQDPGPGENSFQKECGASIRFIKN